MDDLKRWEMGDPAKVLERKGEDCANCKYLERWKFAGITSWHCENTLAPRTLRESAPARRCPQWRHYKTDGGQ